MPLLAVRRRGSWMVPMWFRKLIGATTYRKRIAGYILVDISFGWGRKFPTPCRETVLIWRRAHVQDFFFLWVGGVLPLFLSLCSDWSNVVRPLKHILQMPPFWQGRLFFLSLAPCGAEPHRRWPHRLSMRFSCKLVWPRAERCEHLLPFSQRGRGFR